MHCLIVVVEGFNFGCCRMHGQIHFHGRIRSGVLKDTVGNCDFKSGLVQCFRTELCRGQHILVGELVKEGKERRGLFQCKGFSGLSSVCLSFNEHSDTHKSSTKVSGADHDVVNETRTGGLAARAAATATRRRVYFIRLLLLSIFRSSSVLSRRSG